MLAIDDPLWNEFEGGYRVKYDPRKALRALEAGHKAEAWKELWQELHHQGDVGLASYASVPHLVKISDPRLQDDWNLYALISTIEICRDGGRNPPLPDWLKQDYETALRRIGEIALSKIAATSSEDLLASLFAVVAVCKRQYALARLALLTEQERKTVIDEVGWG